MTNLYLCKYQKSGSNLIDSQCGATDTGKTQRDEMLNHLRLRLRIQAHKARLRCACSFCKVQHDVMAAAGRPKAAFTLAEVLINLGIIGIVAAMTIPNLISTYKKKTVENRLVNAYAVLSQAVNNSRVINGDFERWNFALAPEEFYNTYLKGYIKVQDARKLGDIQKNLQYTSLNGTSTSNLLSNINTYVLMLSNGTLILISNSISTTHKMLGVDINGFTKPNQLGNDLFYLDITKSGGLSPYGYGDECSECIGTNFTRDDIISGSSINGRKHCECANEQEGHWCTLLIYTDGWKIKDDYPVKY